MSEDAGPGNYRLRRPGGDVDNSRIFNVPGVLLGLIVLNVAVFALLAAAPGVAIRLVETSGAVSPERVLAGPAANGGWPALFSPLIAHMFVHASLAHLLFNMFTLLAFGAPLARRMRTRGAFGSGAAFAAAGIFVTFYLLCGVAGAMAYVATHTESGTLLVGASGGVSGLLGGLVRFAFNRTTIFGPEYAAISPITAPPVLTWTAFVIIGNIATGAFGGALTGGASIAWEAHIGGYVFGLLAYPFFERLALAFHPRAA